MSLDNCPRPRRIDDPSPSERNEVEECGSKKRQLLISFGHSLWGFKNWNWSVTKQELDFVEEADGTHRAGAASHVSIAVNSFGLNRQNVGYAVASSPQKGIAICTARKESVTDALRETLMSFGGSVAVQLSERLESLRPEERNNRKNHFEKCNEGVDAHPSPNATAAVVDSKNSPSNVSVPATARRKDSGDGSLSTENNRIKGVKSPQRFGNNQHGVRNAPEKPHNHAQANGNPRIIPQQNAAESAGYPANHSAVQPAGFNSNANKTPSGAPPPSAMVPGNVRPNGGAPPMQQQQQPHAPNVRSIESAEPVVDRSDEELRAERLRRQKQKMDEFKNKHLQKNQF